MTTQTPPISNVLITIPQDNIVAVVMHLIASQINFSVQTYTQEKQSRSLNNEPIKVNETFESNSKKRTEYSLDTIDSQIDLLIKSGEHPNIDTLAKMLNMSSVTFKSKFSQRFGKSFYQYYLDKKFAYAATLLKDGIRASSVSEQIGYSHPIKFNKMFQKFFGITPKKYQMQNRKN